MIACFFTRVPATVAAEETESPWEKASLSLGYFLSGMDTSARLGISGIGIDIDLEETLGLEQTPSVFRVGSLWRFTNNLHHRLDLEWFSLDRKATTILGVDIPIKDENGDTVILPIGTEATTRFDLDLYKLTYSYSFIQDDRLDLAGSFGFYVMPITVGIEAGRGVTKKNIEDFTAPLPAAGLRMDIVIVPKWYLRYQSQFFYLEIDKFTGSLIQSSVALEFRPWKQFSIGLGVDDFNLKIEADGEDYPTLDFKGKINYQHTGLSMYAKFLF
jgi:hypothetical protein